jgi:hypothetical protein
MRYIAILFNLYLLGMVIFLFLTKNAPKGEDWLVITPMILAPLFSLLTLFGSNKDNWLSLYFKRKVLEEKKKIDQLNGKAN